MPDTEKHKHWMFKFEGQTSLWAASIDMDKPVTEEEILEHLNERYKTEETKETIYAWPTA